MPLGWGRCTLALTCGQRHVCIPWIAGAQHSTVACCISQQAGVLFPLLPAQASRGAQHVWCRPPTHSIITCCACACSLCAAQHAACCGVCICGRHVLFLTSVGRESCCWVGMCCNKGSCWLGEAAEQRGLRAEHQRSHISRLAVHCGSKLSAAGLRLSGALERRHQSVSQSCSLVCGTSGALQANNAEMESKVQEMRALLPASVHEQLVAGGEPGLDTEVTLMRWLRARKVRDGVPFCCCCPSVGDFAGTPTGKGAGVLCSEQKRKGWCRVWDWGVLCMHTTNAVVTTPCPPAAPHRWTPTRQQRT